MTLADWVHGVLLHSLEGPSQTQMEMHIFTELVGIQMLLMNTLEPLLRGDKFARGLVKGAERFFALDVRGVGTTGYCMGGRLSLITAANLGERIAAAASFHGGNLAKADDPDSPHHKASAIKAAVYVAGAIEDQSFTDQQKDLLEKSLSEAGVIHTIETYQAHHGFAVPDNASYDADAAERHWKAMEQFFGSVLG